MGVTAENTPEGAFAESILYIEKSMACAEQMAICGGTLSVFATPSPDKSTPNEDALALVPVNNNTCVLILADGVGGMPGGQNASRVAVETLRDKLTRTDNPGGQVMQLILDGIEEINNTLLTQGSGSATTLALVEIQDNMVRPYHIGDSLILITSVMGNIKYQTVSHSPVGYGIESGLLDESEAVLHEERHLVSNILGTRDMRIEIGPVMKLAPRDTLFISSDGIPDNLYINEIVQAIRKGSIDAASKNLVRLAGERMTQRFNDMPCHPDDHSFIMYRPRRMTA